MSKLSASTSGVAYRYATALFSVCEEEGQIEDLENDIAILTELISKSSDFRILLNSPLYKREQQEAAARALASHVGLKKHTKNLLSVLANKGRLYILPEFINGVKRLLDHARDEMGVEVVSAEPLTKIKITELEKKVSELLQKSAKVNVQVDKSLIGGMIVKLGSKMVDTTIKSKLLKMQTKMKEVS